MTHETISHYEIIEKLGEGGMGMVYKAKDNKLDRNVAIKVMLPGMQSGNEGKERFIQEAKAASALDHPNICTIHEIGEQEDGSLFITMAYYEGETLKEYLNRGIPGFDQALNIAIQITRGIACAHQSNITHRDIKPGNIMITANGSVKIVDFGLAKLSDDAHLTQPGSTVGTAAYMSPEQIEGGAVDHRSDVFSCGVVLYELFTGVQPFKSDYYHGMMYAVINEEPPPVCELNPDLPVELEQIIQKAMQKKPENRFQDTNEMVHHLESLQSGSSVDLNRVGSETPAVSDKKLTLINNSKAVVAGVAAIILIALAGLFYWYSPTVTPSDDGIFTTASLPVNKQIAVIPFRNIGEQDENKAFVDGLVETMTSNLSQLDQFQDQFLVVPSSEITSRDIRSASEARAAFGVNLAVTGSVQQLDNGVRVTINLIDAASLRQLDSKIIDDTFREKSVLQDDAVFNLAGMLGIELQPRARTILTAGGTSVPGAYEFYVRGVGHLQRFDRREEIDAAIVQFNRALKEDPNFARAHAGLGDAYLYLYRRTENSDYIQPAMDNIEKAVAITDQYSPVYTTYGLLLIEKGENEKALQMLERALEIDPANFEAYRGKARAFLAQQRTEEAEATYSKAIEMKPDYWAGYAELGVFYYSNGRFEDAARQFEIVTDLTPNNAGAYRNLGGIYYYLGRQEEAMDAFQKSLSIEPNYGAYSNLATMYFYDKEYSKAAEMYQEALALNDSDYSVWSFLSSAYKQSSPPKMEEFMHATRKAKEMAEKQLEVNPRNPAVLADLASFELGLGDSESAERTLKRASDMQPVDVNLQVRIGMLYENIGNRDDALNWIEKAIENGFPAGQLLENSDPELSQLWEDERFLELVNE